MIQKLIDKYNKKVDIMKTKLSGPLSSSERDFLETRVSFFKEVINDLTYLIK